MKKRNFLKTILFVCFVFCFTGCLTTTDSGDVGANRQQLMLISSESMDASAEQSYAEVLAEARAKRVLNVDPATTARVQNIAKRLIAQVGVFRSDAANWNWQVNVIKDNTVNAWCMPGGKIVVYTGIIDTLKLTDGELAAIMGHEISHALREHSRERTSQELIKTLGISVVASLFDLGNVGADVLSLGAQLAVTLPNSRKHETEADHMGTELMARAGYDPYEAVNVWKKMQMANGGQEVPEILSTHPSSNSRIDDLEDIADTVYPLYQAAKK